MNKLRVMVVDDSIIYRKIIGQAVEQTLLAEVECQASNGSIALERLRQRPVDVLLLDIYMPEMDGLQTLTAVKRLYPTLPVIIISGGGTNSAQLTVRALEMGAMDFLLKPAAGDAESNMEQIRRHLHTLFTQVMVRNFTSLSANAVRELRDCGEPPEKPSADRKLDSGQRGLAPPKDVELVLIASSTGGPNALESVLSALPPSFPKPVLVVQHMPPNFTAILAESLNKKCDLMVKEAKDGVEIQNGEVLIAPGGLHMTVRYDSAAGKRLVELTDAPPVKGVRPAADVLFDSAAQAFKGRGVLAVILTGMGSDGTQGVSSLKESCQCFCISQNERSCVVYGMPRSVDEAGLSDESLDLLDIGRRISEIVGRGYWKNKNAAR